MIDLLQTKEAIPDAYPVVAGAEADTDYLWQRIEAYCSHRWTPRKVVWVLEGSGKWQPPLSPVANLTAEKWRGISYARNILCADHTCTVRYWWRCPA